MEGMYYTNVPSGANLANSKANSGHNHACFADYYEGIYVGYKWFETADAEGYWDSYGGYEYNKITPRSMAKLCNNLIKTYPDYLNYSSSYSYEFHGKTYYNSNSFLQGGYKYSEEVDGLKTGTTTIAGQCICISAIINNTK